MRPPTTIRHVSEPAANAESKASPDDPLPLVSVVVPTRNSQRTIERCLRSIREQSYPAIELVVVDNFSTDDTFQISTELADLVISAGPERSAQRNLGIERASG